VDSKNINPANFKILVVDDEEDLRDAISFDFTRRGFKVSVAGSGNEAFRMLEKDRPDVVLSDVRMPDGDGIMLLDKMRANFDKMPVVIFITGYADIPLEQAYSKGVDAVFNKPFNSKDLYEAVQRALQPVDYRFRRQCVRVEANYPTSLEFPGNSIPLNGTAQNLGKGGAFIEYNGPDFPKLGECKFRLEVSGPESFTIQGSGYVRWVRKTPEGDLKPGIGLEFISFEESCFKKIVQVINSLQTKAFIPRG
jgi:CheY-like chemotaxis protein